MNRQPIYPRDPRLRGGNSLLPSFFRFYFTASFSISPLSTVKKTHVLGQEGLHWRLLGGGGGRQCGYTLSRGTVL